MVYGFMVFSIGQEGTGGAQADHLLQAQLHSDHLQDLHRKVEQNRHDFSRWWLRTSEG